MSEASDAIERHRARRAGPLRPGPEGQEQT
jgi:hypothetical protein